MPPHDETSPVGSPAGSVRRPAPSRSRPTSGGGRPPAGGRPRTTAARTGGSARPPAGRRPAGKVRPRRKRTRGQKVRRAFAVLAGLAFGGLVLLGVFIGVVYASTEVPSLSSVQTSQTSIVYYNDGVTEMARLGNENRTNVRLDQISEPARNAVLAAENRSFYTDPGISVSGIARAAWNNVTGGQTQGGSTITQQYVGLSFLDNDATYSGKFKELFLAVKLDNTVSKDEILQNYLNTIYFGRGAYGIEAAANTFFGLPASQLTAQQGAVLAVQIRNPTFYDPEGNLEGASDRWGLVLDGMVEEGWLSAADRAASQYPAVLPKTVSTLGTLPGGPEGQAVKQVLAELSSRHQFSLDDVRSRGLRITTTIDPGRQSAAFESVAEVMDGEPVDVLRQAVVSIDPRNGGVVAYYGGADGTGFDYASQAQRQPGSSMKPYVLATALQQGISVNARRDGTSPQTFPDRPDQPVRNSGNAQCGDCTLVQAMTRSLNTTFYGLAYEVGPENVRTTALAATGLPEVWDTDALAGQRTLSIPSTPENPVPASEQGTGASIGIGEYEMRPIDQAVGFATFANGGVRHAPFFVSRITDSGGGLVAEYAGDAGVQAIPAEVANDVTFALEGVASYSKRALDGNRPVASKTGTVGQGEANSDAWMVGYTPSLATAVWMGSDTLAPIENANGAIIFGSGLPGAIWQQYMDTVLDGTPEEELPDSALIRGDSGQGVPQRRRDDDDEGGGSTSTRPAPTSSRPAPTTQRQPTTAPEPTTESAPTTTQAPATTEAPQPSDEPDDPLPDLPTDGDTEVGADQPDGG